jgi:lysozyme
LKTKLTAVLFAFLAKLGPSRRPPHKTSTPFSALTSHTTRAPLTGARSKPLEFSSFFLKATEGETFVDKLYASNRAGAKAVGIPVGAYHFFRPKASTTAQINNFVKTVAKLQPGDLPPVLDIEVPEDWKDIAVKARVQMILDWLTAVEKKLGVKPLVYINNPMARDELASAAELGNYKLWLAHYTDRPAPRVPAPWAGWTFWQYSELGVVDGVPSKTCDMNRFAGTSADLQRLLVPAKSGRIRRKIISVLSRILRV